jgi:uncharacterized protein (TIGR00297 family)
LISFTRHMELLTSLLVIIGLLGLLVLFAMMVEKVRNKVFRVLTKTAVAAALLVGFAVLAGITQGFVLLVAFFAMGVWATSHGKTKKIKEGPSQPRTAGQVFANGGVAGLMGMLSFYFCILNGGDAFPFLIAAAGSLSAATADTLSSELGMVYGRRFYNILNFKPSPAGPDGVISLEGTLLGAAGALVIALLTYACTMVWWGSAALRIIPVITVVGIVGTLIDSLLGATLERRGLLGNDVVNFLNTVAGASTALLLS